MCSIQIVREASAAHLVFVYIILPLNRIYYQCPLALLLHVALQFTENRKNNKIRFCIISFRLKTVPA